MNFAYSQERILRIIGAEGEVSGFYDGRITGIASLAEAGPGDLAFLGNPKYRGDAENSKASVLILPEDFAGEPGPGQSYIRVPNPSYALALVCRDMESFLFPKPEPGVHPSVIVGEGAEIASEATIGPFCSIGAGAKIGACVLDAHTCVGREAEIGDETRLFPGVVVGDYCRVGGRNRLSAGCVLGADGFGYEFAEGSHQRVPQIGNVVTEADVDIGANTTVDRARFGSTWIGQGTKIDNLVQIAHNVRIGRHCLIVSQVGISGSTELGDGVVIGGQSGTVGHITIGAGARIAGKTGVNRSIGPGQQVRGIPAEPLHVFNRVAVLQRKLPDLFKRFDRLERMVETLQAPDTKT